MCYKVGQELVLNLVVAREYGDCAHFTQVGGHGPDILILPDKTMRACNPNPNLLYNEREEYVLIHGIKIPLEEGFERVSDNSRNVISKGAKFNIALILYKQTIPEKESGTFRIKSASLV